MYVCMYVCMYIYIYIYVYAPIASISISLFYSFITCSMFDPLTRPISSRIQGLMPLGRQLAALESDGRSLSRNMTNLILPEF